MAGGFNQQDNENQLISISELFDVMREWGYRNPENDIGFLAGTEGAIEPKLLEQFYTLETDTYTKRPTKKTYYGRGRELKSNLKQFVQNPGSIDIYIEKSFFISLVGHLNKINTRQNSSDISDSLIKLMGTYNSELMNTIIAIETRIARENIEREAREAQERQQKQKKPEDITQDESDTTTSNNQNQGSQSSQSSSQQDYDSGANYDSNSSNYDSYSTSTQESTSSEPKSSESTIVYSDDRCATVSTGANIPDANQDYSKDFLIYNASTFLESALKIDVYDTEKQSAEISHMLQKQQEEHAAKAEAEKEILRQNRETSEALNANKMKDYQESSSGESYWQKTSRETSSFFNDLVTKSIEKSLEKYDKQLYAIEQLEKEIEQELEYDKQHNPNRDYADKTFAESASGALGTSAKALSYVSSETSGAIQMVKLYCDLFNDSVKTFQDQESSIRQAASFAAEDIGGIMDAAHKQAVEISTAAKENAIKITNGLVEKLGFSKTEETKTSTTPILSEQANGFDTSSSGRTTSSPQNLQEALHVQSYLDATQRQHGEIRGKFDDLAFTAQLASMGINNVKTLDGQEHNIVGSASAMSSMYEDVLKLNQTQLKNVPTTSVNTQKPLGSSAEAGVSKHNPLNQAVERAMSYMAAGHQIGKKAFNFSYSALRIARNTFEIEQSDSTRTFDEVTRYSPLMGAAINTARYMSEAKKAGKEFTNIDIGQLKNILSGSSKELDLRVLTGDLAKNFSKEMLVDGLNSVNLTESLVEQLRKKGFTRLTDKLDIKVINQYIKTLKKQAANGVPGAAESLQAMTALHIAAAKGGYAFNIKALFKDTGLTGLKVYGRLIKGATNNTAATDMISTGVTITSILRGNFASPFRRAYKTAAKMARTGGFKSIPGKPIRNLRAKGYQALDKTITKNLRFLRERSTGKSRVLVQRALNARDPRAVTRGLSARKNLVKNTRNLLTKLKNFNIKEALAAVKAVFSKEGIKQLGINAVSQVIAHGLGAGTGGLAYLVYAIIAIIVCCICCCCSFGTGYTVYENVNVFALTADGSAATSSNDSLAVHTLEFMYDNFDKNYPDFILKGVKKYFEKNTTQLEIKNKPGKNYAFEYEDVKYVEGKVTVVDPNETAPDGYEKYVFYLDKKSGILYSDYDHTKFEQLYGGADFQIDTNGDVVNIVIDPATGLPRKPVDLDDVNAIQRPIYNDREIIAMAATALSNDFGMTPTGSTTDTTKTLANYEDYSLSLWLLSHYCSVDDGNIWDTIVDFFSSFFTNLFNKTLVADADTVYTNKIDNIYLSNISCVWDSTADTATNPNIITPLSQNAYSPEPGHYINTPLIFDDTSNTVINKIKEAKTSKRYATTANWYSSPTKWTSTPSPETAKPYAPGNIPAGDALKQIEKSYLKMSVQVSYETYKYKLSDANVSTINTYSGYASSWDTTGAVHTSFDTASSNLSSVISSPTFVKDTTATIEGYDCSTEAKAKEAAQEITAGIYRKLGTYFGKSVNDSTTAIHTSDTEGSKDGNQKGVSIKDLGTEDKVKTFIACLEATIPLGDDYITYEEALDDIDAAYTAWATDKYYIQSSVTTDSYQITKLKKVTTDYEAETSESDTNMNGVIEPSEITVISPAYTKYHFASDGTLTIPGKAKEYYNVPILFNETQVSYERALSGTYRRLSTSLCADTTNGLKDTYTRSVSQLFTHYLVCGGHTQIVIQPVTLTYVGSVSLFDINEVLEDVDSGDFYKDKLFPQPITFSQYYDSTTEDIWNLDLAIGRENRLNAVNMVGKSWAQYYRINWTTTSLNANFDGRTSVANKEIYTLVDPYSERLYNTQEEAETAGGITPDYTHIYNEEATSPENSIEVIMFEAEVALAKHFGTSLVDLNGDGRVNKADLEMAVEKNNTAAIKAISEVINRLERVSLALNTVGTVGYTQASHVYATSSPLGPLWSYNNAGYNVQITDDAGNNKTLNLADLFDMGDDFHYPLLYKTDCSGFASYVAGWDHEPNTSGNFESGSFSITLPPITDTLPDYDAATDKLDPVTKTIYDTYSGSITYTNYSITWASDMSSTGLLPGDFVTKDGHVMVYLAPGIIDSKVDLTTKKVTDYGTSANEHLFAECTAHGGILGPGAVKLTRKTPDKLNTQEYKYYTSIPFDMRMLNVLN